MSVVEASDLRVSMGHIRGLYGFNLVFRDRSKSTLIRAEKEKQKDTKKMEN